MTRSPRNSPSSLLSRLSQPSAPPSSLRWAARHLSNSPSLRESTSNQNSPRPAGPTGGFPGLSGRSWGTFGSGTNQSTTGSLATGGLLPHEKQARLRAVDNTQPKAPPKEALPAAAPRRETTRDQPSSPLHQEKQGRFQWRAVSGAQAYTPKSVLADVFKTDREPHAPPTPDSWTSEKQGATKSTPGQMSEKVAAPFAQCGVASRLFADRKSTIQEPAQIKKPGSSQGQAWGSFQNRKVLTKQAATKPVPLSGNTQPAAASAPQTSHDAIAQTTAKTAPKLVPQSGNTQPAASAVSQASQDAIAQTTEKTAPKPATGSFWDELENRFSHLDKKDDNKNPAVAADGRPVKAQETQRDKSSKKTKKVRKSARRQSENDDWEFEAANRWDERQRSNAKKAKRVGVEEPKVLPIFIPEYINVSNLASSLKQRPTNFLRDMEEMGFENVTPDTIMTGETAALVAMEYGFEPTIDTGSQRDLKPRPAPEQASSLPGRPPIVTIMGHVDHGKTTLLDWLRKSSVAAQEHGGITQHIGAFIVKMSSGKPITFLDTPGHAAFLSMRKRGANVTDIVVLVVAADDSVMPQTIEALKHATAAKVPIIVAINKIDKESARVDHVKADLARHGVEIEDFGGDVQVVCVSGKTGQGMDDLEENIIALSEMLDVRAETAGMAEGWVLESSIKQDGKAATVLVKRGTLRPGDLIVAGKSWARIRLLRNEAGVEMTEAPPGTPVEILGWRDLPPAGDQVLQAPDENRAKMAVEYRTEMAEREESSKQLVEQEQRQREKAAEEAAKRLQEEKETEKETSESVLEEPKMLQQNFVVKADVVGSAEAVCAAIQELGNNEVCSKILRSSAGQISEYDVDHAATSNSIIVNFNSPVLPHIRQRAEAAKVRIMDHSVIYHVVDDAKSALSALLPDNVSHRVLGEADVLQIFPINIKKRMYKNIAGCRIRNGAIKKVSRVKVMRKGEVIFEGKIDTFKHVKKDVAEMGKGSECGIGLEGFEDLQVDDQIQTYEEIREKRML
ncbi:hypothetical protein HIM_08221 [Hirsutella minnesotensis 3608]|uniref:Translation initiation factor IF-2, mitochondrial n=1 Tax=Hirsutella minnesotensis 3608 TaxID=1043627 RepID=A0A0F7ZT34_9HYPO|nr:hypothetical protein HIM_08221 [Hirsutella minnesotensis 3608]